MQPFFNVLHNLYTQIPILRYSIHAIENNVGCIFFKSTSGLLFETENTLRFC